MRGSAGFTSLLLLAASIDVAPAAAASEPAGLHEALDRLTQEGKFSGAVVIRGPKGVRFARGYGLADPFERRAFAPDTPADSASLAKPFTAAAVLLLVRAGKVDLDEPVKHYLPEFPHSSTTVRHLLSHSAGLELKESVDGLANKTNAALLAESGAQLFPAGSAFTYCNLCSIALALLIERVTGQHYLKVVKERVWLPQAVALRPQRLVDWPGRAIGYQRRPDGTIQRFDSWEGELLYGAANFSISAMQLAEWGSQWWQSGLAPIRAMATRPARIGGHESGLTLGNWYCSRQGQRCHYLGHHEGFHHMLYWDADRRISVAMLTNNALAPGLQQRVQRALVAYAEGEPQRGKREVESALAEGPVPVGQFQLPNGTVEIVAYGERRSVRRDGIEYPAYLIGSGIRYVPGLDLYVSGTADGRLRWLSLYEDFQAVHESKRSLSAPRANVRFPPIPVMAVIDQKRT